MKYWKLLFLCLAVNSCNLEKDPIQPVIDKTELQAINKALYQNFIVLASLREIAKILEYKISQEEGHETIIFCCDTFSQTIRDKEVEIRAELEKKLKDKPILSGRDEITKRGLVKLSEDEVFNKTIMQTLELDNKNEADPIKLLATVCKHFFLFNQTFFLSLRENLEKYEKKLNGGQVQNSVKAFIKLSKYLGNFVAKYEEMSEGFDDEQRVSFFFGNFLPQYFNIYHEHIFREEKDKNKGCTKCGLSLINAMQ